jgi:hypothetical protein
MGIADFYIRVSTDEQPDKWYLKVENNLIAFAAFF